jgi:hypothetical protein
MRRLLAKQYEGIEKGWESWLREQAGHTHGNISRSPPDQFVAELRASMA